MERKKLRSSISRNDESVGRRKMEQERERKKERGERDIQRIFPREIEI